VCLALVACGDNIHVMTPDELSEAYTDSDCRYWVRCGVFPDLEACRQVHLWRVDPDVTAAIVAGVVEFHGDVAEACVAWVDTLGCDPTDAAHREVVCSGVYTGTKHEGEPCAFGTECISQECWLEGAPCTGACCSGYCTGDTPPPIAGIGERCRYAPCSEGYCDDSLCVPLHGDGEPCTGTAQCEIGLSCNGGQCMRLPGVGEPCVGQCREVGQRCNGMTERCERVAWRGEYCFINDDCSPFYSCTIDGGGVCGLAVLGDSCAETWSCALPAVCDFRGALQCIAPKPDGEPCLFSRDCASGNCAWPSMKCTSTACF